MAKMTAAQMEKLVNKATELSSSTSMNAASSECGFKNVTSFKNALWNACVELGQVPPKFTRARKTAKARGRKPKPLPSSVTIEVKSTKSGTGRASVPKEVFQVLKVNAGEQLKFDLKRTKVIITRS
ncbi:MAG TPA: hypothetical protein EYM25_04650 [Deltaproteobacteria bacterium]|mgnify:CR=1 FL=1|nr:hypothetical protein [Deltaproteobacteria bacterium]